MLKWMLGLALSSSFVWATPILQNPQVFDLETESTVCPKEFKLFFKGLQPLQPRTGENIQGELALRSLFKNMVLKYQNQRSWRTDCEYKVIEYQCDRSTSRHCHNSIQIRNPWVYDAVLVRFYNGDSRLHAFFDFVQNNSKKLAGFEVEIPMDQNQRSTLYAFPKSNVRVPIGKIKDTTISIRQQ